MRRTELCNTQVMRSQVKYGVRLFMCLADDTLFWFAPGLVRSVLQGQFDRL